MERRGKIIMAGITKEQATIAILRDRAKIEDINLE